MKQERYIESVQKVMIDGREITVTQTRPVLTPEELLAAQIEVKKIIVNILKKKK